MDERIKLGGAVTGIAAIAFSVGLAISGTGSEGAKTNATIEAAQEAVEPMTCSDFDRGDYSERMQELRAQDANLRDLGGQCVQPGATSIVGANFELGTRIAGVELFRGKDEFALSGAGTCTDKPKDNTTWCEIAATNTSAKAELLLVLVRIAKDDAVSDAGVGSVGAP